MSRDEISAAVREALIKHARTQIHDVRNEDRPVDLGFDSFALLEVMLTLEDRFGIEVDPGRLAEVREMRVSDIVELVALQLPEQDG